MYLSLLTCPLITFCCIALFGRFIGARGTIILSVLSSILCALISMTIFYEVALCRAPCQITLAPFFHGGLFAGIWNRDGWLAVVRRNLRNAETLLPLVSPLLNCDLSLLCWTFQDYQFGNFPNAISIHCCELLHCLQLDRQPGG